MGVVIVSTNDIDQENDWQERLHTSLPALLGTKTIVLAVHEDWIGGAGNGLGSLYAFNRAREKGIILYGIDIVDQLNHNASIAIYHTAGYGKCLAPLVCAERYGTSSVKLPCMHGNTPLSILEAAIQQTARLVENRKGRLSVFWGNQVLIPSGCVDTEPKHHIEICAQTVSDFTENSWRNDHAKNHGIVIEDRHGNVRHLGKIARSQLQHLSIDETHRVGISMGAFSLSKEILLALLEEFQPELSKQKGMLDSDFHFWMPMTLSMSTYLELAGADSIDHNETRQHHQRMHAFAASIAEMYPHLKLFGILDMDYWWDYSTVQNYFQNIQKALSHTPEGDTMRKHYRLPPPNTNNSILIDCNIGEGTVNNSILIGVIADSIHINGGVIFHSRFSKLDGQNCLLYKVTESRPLSMPLGTIRADASVKQKNVPMYSSMVRNGKKDWSNKLPQNQYSYEEILKINSSKIPRFSSAMRKPPQQSTFEQHRF